MQKTNKLPIPIKESLIREVLVLLKQNHSPAMIEKDLAGTYTPDQINEAISEAAIILKTDHFTNSQEVLILHTKRYQKDINRLLSFPSYPETKNPTDKQIFAFRERKVKACFRCIETMNQLETLLHLGANEGTTLEVNNSVQFNIHAPEKKSPYDITKLTFDERLELYNLIKITRVEMYGQVPAITQAVQVSEETTNTLLIEDAPPNIQGIRQTTHKPVILENDNTSINPVSKLRENLKRIQAKQIRDAGGHLDEQEIKILNRNN